MFLSSRHGIILKIYVLKERECGDMVIFLFKCLLQWGPAASSGLNHIRRSFLMDHFSTFVFFLCRFVSVSGQDVEPLCLFVVHLTIQDVLLVVKQAQKLLLQFITFIFLATAGLTCKIMGLEQDEIFVPE